MQLSTLPFFSNPLTQKASPIKSHVRFGHAQDAFVLSSPATASNSRAAKSASSENLHLTDPLPLEFQLMVAAEAGDLATVTSLINAGVDPNCHDDQWRTPLMGACRGNHPEIVALLLEKGSSAKALEYDPVETGICRTTPLLQAVQNAADPRIIEMLLSRGANHSGEGSHISPPAIVLLNLEQRMAKLQEKVHPTWTLEDLKTYQVAVLKMLVDAGMDINIRDSYKRTLLAYAVIYKNRQAFDILMDHYAQQLDLNCQTKPNESGTLLMKAAEYSQVPKMLGDDTVEKSEDFDVKKHMVERLLAAGADPTLKVNGGKRLGVKNIVCVHPEVRALLDEAIRQWEQK